MALQLNITTPQGVPAPEAYAQITSFRGNKVTVMFVVDIFFNAAVAVQDGIQPLQSLSYTVPYTDGAGIAVLYTYLKTLPEFAGAIDV